MKNSHFCTISQFFQGVFLHVAVPTQFPRLLIWPQISKSNHLSCAFGSASPGAFFSRKGSSMSVSPTFIPHSASNHVIFDAESPGTSAWSADYIYEVYILPSLNTQIYIFNERGKHKFYIPNVHPWLYCTAGNAYAVYTQDIVFFSQVLSSAFSSSPVSRGEAPKVNSNQCTLTCDRHRSVLQPWMRPELSAMVARTQCVHYAVYAACSVVRLF